MTPRHALLRSIAFATTLLSVVTVSATGADANVTISPHTTYGEWEGWGASLCWWAGVFGQRDDLADTLFTRHPTHLAEAGATLPGLDLNIVRYNAGACSFNSVDGAAMSVSPNIPAFRQMSGYWVDPASPDPDSAGWDWSVDANQRAMLLKARARGADLFELFSNSPMWWMCANRNPSGSETGATDNLAPAHRRDHAIYLATIAQRARASWGVAFTSVAPFNEPTAAWWKASGTQEGCHFERSTQATVIDHLRAELTARGLGDTIVSASDESYYDQATGTWNSFSAATRAQVGRSNVHGYQYGGGRRDLLFTAVAGQKLWNSEYGENDGTGLSLAANLTLDFRWLHPTAWCYWQPFDSGGWGLVQCNPGDNWIGPANPKYYVLAQYTRHIRPGMTILDSGSDHTVAAYDPVSRTLVLVGFNAGATQTVTYDLSQFKSVGGPVARWITLTGPGEKYAVASELPVVDRRFSATFPAGSVQTFEVSDVTTGLEPVMTTHPLSLTQPAGTAATLSAAASGPGLSLQWYRDGIALPGATSASLELPSLSAGDAGDYTCEASGPFGSVTSRLARVRVGESVIGRIVNLSVRSVAGRAGNPLIIGFVVAGGAKQLLVRAIGPSLADYGVSGLLADPALAVHQTIDGVDTIAAANDDWGADGGASVLAPVFGQLGAFALAPDSKDAALTIPVDGSRTVHVFSPTTGESGVVLGETYDAAPGAASRLINISARNFAGRDAESLIAGFVIDGTAPKRLLVRGVGPGLIQHNVPGVLADPQLAIYETVGASPALRATNDDWGDEPGADTVAALVGAFALDPGSKDAAIVITVPPGAYTAVLTGADGGTDEALVEVYEAP